MRLTNQQLQDQPSDELKQKAKNLYDIIYARPTGSRPTPADSDEFHSILLELETRGFKAKRLNTIYFCDSC